MKKIILIIMLFFCFSMPVSADNDAIGDAENFYKSSGGEDLYSGDMLEDNGVTFSDPKSILSLTPSKIWDMITTTVKDKVTAPLRLFVSVLIVIIFASLADGMGKTVKSKEMSGVLQIVCTLAVVGVIYKPVCESIEIVTDTLTEGSEFMISFIPVFSSITAAGGHVTSAAGYSAAVYGFSNLSISAAKDFFMPLLSMCICTAIVNCCCDGINLSGIINSVKKIVTWGLGFIMTIFTGLLSIQSIVGASADSVAAKTAKYVISNSIPLVGSAASDAYSTVKGSIILLKNGVGSIGIIALAVMLLPSLLHMLMYKLSFFFLGSVSEIFGTKKLTILFNDINAVLSAAFGILICFMLMFIISTGAVMSICTASS